MVGIDDPDHPGRTSVHRHRIPRRSCIERQEGGAYAKSPVLRESDASYYLREERQGLLLGPYEKGAPHLGFVDGVPSTASRKDLAPRRSWTGWSRTSNAAINRVPIFGEAGVKEVINGPICLYPRRQPAWSARRGGSRTSGSTRATASALPLRAGRAGSSPSGSSRATPTIDMLGRRSAALRRVRLQGPTCGDQERGGLRERLRHPFPRTRSARPPGPLKTSAHATTSIEGARRRVRPEVTAGSGPTGSRPKGVAQARTTGAFRRSAYFHKHVGNECRNWRTITSAMHRHDQRSPSSRSPGPGAEAYPGSIWWRNSHPQERWAGSTCAHALNKPRAACARSSPSCAMRPTAST